jgi:hypothetical protein
VAVRATEGTTKLMAAQNQPDFRAEFWDRVFPGQIPAGDVELSVVDETGFELEAFPDRSRAHGHRRHHDVACASDWAVGGR